MIRTVVITGALLLAVGAVMAQQDLAVKQDNLMRSQARSLYGVILKMAKGDTPYDQRRVDAAIAQLEESVSTIGKVFETNPGEDVGERDLTDRRRRSGRTRADFDSRIRRSPRRSPSSRVRSATSPA